MTKRHGPKTVSRPLDIIHRPLEQFAHKEISAGVVLLAATLVATLWANSRWAGSYTDLQQTMLTIRLGENSLSKPLESWINDGLMAIFFFVVGLEIKREILMGRLSSPRKAALPIMAAVGGMILPALFYAALNLGHPEIMGWGIPMATDIAFALGVLALLGKCIPASLRIFLAALAIVDDLGAVLVIAFFYNSEISWDAIAAAGLLLLLLITANLLKIRTTLVYAGLGFLLWLAVLKSGVHATISGVLAAMTIPVRPLINRREFVSFTQKMADSLEDLPNPDHPVGMKKQQSVVQSIKRACHFLETPLHQQERLLHPWVALFIMPIFALTNAGVPIEGDFGSILLSRSSLGIIIGLLFGKQLGILLFSWLAVKIRIAYRPESIYWRQIYGIGWVAGIGFTMSIFIAGLAFDSVLLNSAKMSILVASILAGAGGFILLRYAKSTASTESTENHRTRPSNIQAKEQRHNKTNESDPH